MFETDMSFRASPSRPPPEPDTVLRGHLQDVQTVVIEPGVRFLLSGDSLGEIRLWDLGTKRTASKSRPTDAAEGILALSLSPEGTQLISQTREGALSFVNVDPSGSLTRDPKVAFCTECYNFCRMSVLWSGPTAVLDSFRESLPQERGLSSNYSFDGASTSSVSSTDLVAVAGKNPENVEVWDLVNRRLVIDLNQQGKSKGMCMAVKLFTSDRKPGCPLLLAGCAAGPSVGRCLLLSLLFGVLAKSSSVC